MPPAETFHVDAPANIKARAPSPRGPGLLRAVRLSRKVIYKQKVNFADAEGAKGLKFTVEVVIMHFSLIRKQQINSESCMRMVRLGFVSLQMMESTTGGC